MKETKALYANATNNSHDYSPIYLMQRHEKDPWQRVENTSNFGAQYDSKKDNIACTCKNIRKPNEHRYNGGFKQTNEHKYFGGSPKQIYTYRASKSFIDIGVGSVKALQRRKMKRVYLRETDDTGVGSSDLSSYCFPKKPPKAARDSYDSKRTSSKCVGGTQECITGGCFINQKLSPIIQTKSFATSPEIVTALKNTEIGSNTIEKTMETTGVQFENDEEVEKPESYAKTVEPNVLAVEVKPIRIVSEQTTQLTKIEKHIDSKNKAQQEKRAQKSCSSDSLLQHVHNLESPSKEKHSEASFRDPMENKLEKEYRKIFSIPKSKDSKSSYDTSVSAFKSASILRRRFEALKRGKVKKEDSVSKKTDSINMSIMSKRESLLSHKDASVASDPPSLVSRSYSSTKKYSPLEETVESNRKQTSYYKKEKVSAQWNNPSQSESQGVKGMFKLWGKKFNFEEDADGKRRASPMSSYNKTKKPSKEAKPSVQEANKKENRKFFFFKKKTKDKNKDGYKPKKNVTAGRCEVKEGLVLNIGGTVTPKVIAKISEETSEITRRTWLRRFLSSTIESAKSVNVRWNNNMFATSSSTVFELLDSVYKNTGVVIKSRSEITTEESSMYRSYTKNKVNFVRDIEAWMMPRTVLDKPIQPLKLTKEKEKDNSMKVSMSDQKWFIDKSEAFAHTIEVVLNSENIMKLKDKASSECLKIDIPKDFFETSSSNASKRNHSSDEKVFQIVEYETNSEINGRKAINDLKESYRTPNDVQVVITVKDSKNFQSQILETVIKRLPTGEVMVKGSNISSKRCDVIGVGIITQRDMREIRKPILKIQDDLTDYDSDPIPQLARKKCEFAESYLQEYYRNWTPLGIDLYSWCVSDSHLKSCSEKSFTSFHNQGDGSKSCPNIYEDFHTATIIASGEMSCNSPCAYEETCCNEKFGKLKKKFKKLPKAKTESELADKRIMPKDSLEVFKRRKLYAASGKSQWACFGGVDKLVSVPSVPSSCSRNSQVEMVTAPACPPAPRYCKRVSMSPCDKPEGILTYKGAACESCKKGKCAKHPKIIPTPTCQIPEPPCKPSCEKMKNPACNKPNVPSCHDVPKCPSNKSICPISPLPSSCGPRLAPRCFPKDNQSKPPPCPATLPPCKMPATPECMLPSAPSCSACAKSSCSSSKKSCSPSPCSSPCKKSCSPPPPCARSPSALESIMTWIKSSTSKCDSNTCPSTDKCCPHPPPGPCKNVKKSPSPCESPKKCSSGDLGYPLKRVKTPCGSGSSQNIQCAPQDPCFPDPPCGQRPCSTQPSCPAQATCPKSPSPPCSPKSTCKKPTCPPKPTSPACSPKPPCGSPKPPCGSPKPPCGSPKPPCGSPKPPCGSPKPPSGSPKPPCGSPKPFCGSRKPPCGSPKPPCGSPKPSCGSPKPPCGSPKSSCGSSKPPCGSPPCGQKPTCIASPPCSPKLTCPPNPCPPKPPPMCEHNPAALPKIHFPNDIPCSPRCTKAKISGIFLKMKPSGVKNCSPGCTSWDHTTTKLQGVKLTADENLCIQIKNETPSTEEIRDCGNQRNFKVADEDGRTLFERKDYTCGSQRNSMLGDLYRQSKINRVAAPIAVTNVSTDEDSKDPSALKSDQNLGNMIEINFKLRITQGDKTTEVNIGNENDDAKQDTRTEIRKAHPEIYVVKNGQDDVTPDMPKNDINIKITVRNYKPTLAKIEHKRCSDEFSKKISEKFHTVSTGYSDLDENEDHVFSIHRATVNLSSSVDISNTPSKTISHDHASKIMNVEFDQNPSLTTEQIPTDCTDNEIIEEKSETSRKESVNIEETKTDESIPHDFNNEHDDTLVALSTSNEYNDTVISKHASRENKKILLKKVFQKAGTQNKTKKTVRQLRDMLKIILTDSSDNDDKNENGNDLIKDVTYASLKPNYFRDTDSMNNYYQLESTLSSIKGSNTEAIYPTEDDNSPVSRSSDSDANDVTFQGCMCSKVAEKLNQANMKVNCCCREKLKTDEETNCDLRNEQDFFLLNYKTAEYVDVETQNSKYICSKINNLNVSLHSRNFEKTIEDITVVEKINITPPLSKKASPNHSIQENLLNNKDVNISNDNAIVVHEKFESNNRFNKDFSDAKEVIDINFGAELCDDILQSYEAKKAVLEIYAEKAGDKLVAKLPKFLVDREHEIVNNYEQLSTNSYKSVCKQNFVIMSIRQK